MDNLGVAMNATTLDAYALEKGYKKTYSTMTKAEQVQLAYEMFLDRTSQYAGNYAKENKTFAGSFTTLKASVENFLSGAGEIDDVIENILNFSDILVESISEMAPKIVTGIIKLINSLVPQIPTLLQKLLPTVINGVVQLMNGLVSSLPTIIPILMNGVIQAVNGLLPLIPTIIGTLLEATLQIIIALANALPTMLPQIVDAIMKIIPILISYTPQFLQAGIQIIGGLLKGILQSVPTILSNMVTIGVNILKNIWNGVSNWANNLYNNIKLVINKIVGFFTNIVGSIKNVGINLVKGLWNGISSVTDWVLNKIKGFGNSILSGIKRIFGIHSPSVEFAYVGQMNAEGLIQGMEGMQGEIQDTFDGMFDLSPNLYGNTSANLSPSINVVNNMSFETDPLGQVVGNVKTFSNGAKNDFNYGFGG